MSLKVTAAYASIAQLTIYLNLPVDVPLRLRMTRARRKLGRELRAEERKRIELGDVSPSPDEVPVDRLPIRMANIQFKYGAAKEEEEDEAAASAQGSQSQNSGSFSDLIKPNNLGDISEAPATTEATPTLTAQEKSERARKRFRMIRESLNLTVDEDDRKKHLVAESGNLDGVELELQQGKVVAIVGAPSQGKATILR
jgi:ABC-type multidrug transport system fused ATPase/permease subunit